MTHGEFNDYPDREKAMIEPDTIETPERPKITDGYAKPDNVAQGTWDGYTDQQKKAAIATFNAIKKHADKHGGK